MAKGHAIWPFTVIAIVVFKHLQLFPLVLTSITCGGENQLNRAIKLNVDTFLLAKLSNIFNQNSVKSLGTELHLNLHSNHGKVAKS